MKKHSLKKINDAHIGIWWIIDGHIVKCSTSVNEVPESDGWKDIPTSHFDYWENTLKVELPNLQNCEYTDHPRGRVLLNVAKQAYVIYGSKTFTQNKRQISVVKNAFNLSNCTVMVQHDKHYDDAIPLLDIWDLTD